MKRILSLFFFACSLLSVNAYGFDFEGLQPLSPYGVFSTFSAESLPSGKSGLEVGFERSLKPDFYRITNQFGYGFTDSIEFDITVPYVIGYNSVSGFEDMSIGLKHRFFDEGKYGPSVAYLLTASLNSGRSDFSTEGSVGAGIIVTKRVGPVTGHLNLLFSHPLSNSLSDEVTFAAGLDFAAANNFKVLAELYSEKNYSGRVDRIEPRFGYRIVSAENLFTTVGVGFDLKDRRPEYRLLLSLSYIFPSEQKKIKKVYEQEE